MKKQKNNQQQQQMKINKTNGDEKEKDCNDNSIILMIYNDNTINNKSNHEYGNDPCIDDFHENYRHSG